MKAGIVGTGAVGSSAAYAMIMDGTVSELVLIDPNEGLVGAQAEDLEDSTLFPTLSAGERQALEASARVLAKAAKG